MKTQGRAHSPVSSFSSSSLSLTSHDTSLCLGTIMDGKCSIATLSLGRAWVHSLEKKLDQAAAHHFNGIELFYEDLEYIAKALPGGLTPANQLLAAQQIRSMCESRHLSIICLQPFMHYEGLLDRARHAERVEDFKFWLQLCKNLGTDLIAIPSNFLTSGVTGDWDVLVADMREVADLAAQEGLRIAYEALCWGVFVDTWERSYELACAVDRENFGICLDTFNICGREYADPSADDGCVLGADEAMRKSLKKMTELVDVNKVFFVQAADAERMRVPLREEHSFHIKGQPPRMSWSRNARLFPGESSRGAYLPVLDVLRVLTGEDGLKYRGWISFEVFSRSLADSRPGVVEDHANRAEQSRKWLEKELCLGQEIHYGPSNKYFN